MDPEYRLKIQSLLAELYPKSLDHKDSAHVTYGTAGFRGNATSIQHLFFKVGVISGLRSLQLSANVGVMVTASHNPIQDNGVKLVDPSGEMLEQSWEQLVENFCNIKSPEQLLNELDLLCKKHNVNLNQGEKAIRVLLGMDTRPSSEALAALVKRGINLWSPLVSCIDLGQLTTPVLHYLVARSNVPEIDPPQPDTYYKQLINGFYDIFSREKITQHYCRNNLVVDCANGVGVETMNQLCKSNKFSDCLKVKLINTGDGVLNKLCGADYVKTTHLRPTGAEDTTARYVSLDGDADRLVYFYLEGEDLKLHLLDGDKLLALYALFIRDMLKSERLEDKLSLGVVQTAYANGASTHYLKHELNLQNVDCVDTGVKNLHARAVHYDIGIYFEANGHGTIWFSNKAKVMIEKLEVESTLSRILKIINNYTGDAISDILLAEAILLHYDWDIETWNKLYIDKANSLTKVKVTDRNQVETTNAGRICTKPEGLQHAIDTTVAKYGPGARCFVRPSGTEDCVRIYAEADDQTAVENLSKAIADLVCDHCNKSGASI